MEFTVIVALLLIWAVVTLLGHGTWVVLASLFRSSPQPPREAPSSRSTCPRCRGSLDTAMNRCNVCGWPSDVGVRTDERAALRSLHQQLVRLGDLRAIDPQTVVTLLAAIQAEENKLTQSKSAKPAEVLTLTEGDLLEPDAVVRSQAPKVAPAASATPRPHAPQPLAERAAQYSASRQAAVDEPFIAPPPPPKKREAISRFLSAFMEKKNIRWGELVGGLLIVGCSIALVISFWAQIAARPILKFVLFNGVTAALFGVGLYTDRRWKIHTTSHGVLIIATLLVPLNFLAIAAFTQGSPPTDVWSLGGEIVSVVVFALLVYLAGQVIAPGAAVLLAIGVMLPSVTQLLVRRWAEPAAPLDELYALAVVPTVSYLASTGLEMRRRVLNPPLDELASHQLLAFLGVVSAASLVPFALLAFKTPPIWDTIHRLSPLLVWCGVPGLLAGLLFWRHLTDRSLVAVQTAGVAVGVLGAAVMAGAVVAAWPDPATLLPVALMNVVALAVVAFEFGIPAALIPAGLALAVAWLIAFHLIRGDVTWTLPNYEPMASALLSAASGHALVPLVGVLGAITWLLRRLGRREDCLMTAITTGIVVVGSLALVMWFGFARVGDPLGAFWTLAIYAAVAIAAAAVTNLPSLAWISPAVLLAAVVQGVGYRWGEALGLARPSVVAMIVHAGLMVVGVAAVRLLRRGQNNLRGPFEWWAVVSSVAAAGLVTGAISITATSSLAAYIAAIGVVWLALSILSGWPVLFTVAQLALAAAVAFSVTAAVETRPWYAAARHPWLDPWFLESQGIALAVFCLVWSAVRWVFARATHEREYFVFDLPAPGWVTAGSRLLNPLWPTVDHLLEAVLPALFVLVAMYAAVPGVGQELSPLDAARGSAPAVRVVTPIEEYQIAGIDHNHAADRGAWLFGFAAVALLLAGVARRHAVGERLCVLLVVLAMICPLVAVRWEADVAVASALRWLSAGFLFAASVPMWLRSRWAETNLAGVLSNRPLFQKLRDVVVGMVVLMYVAIGTYVAQAALRLNSPTATLGASFPFILGWAVIAALAALAIQYASLPLLLGTAAGPESARRIGDRSIRDAMLLLAFGPLAVWFAFAVALALDQHPIVGPELTSWFRRIGWDVSYGVPLAVISLALVGHAIRDRSSSFAFGAGLLANVVATIVLLLRLARGGGSLDSAAWITVAQANAIVAGIVALAWLAAITWHRAQQRDESEASPGPSLQGRGSGTAWPLLLVTQAALAAALCGMFILPGVVQTSWSPRLVSPWLIQSGSPIGWFAGTLATAAAGWIQWRRPVSQALVAFFAAGFVGILALTGWRWDTGNWEAFHTLLAGVCAAAWLVPLATRLIDHFRSDEQATAEPLVWSTVSARLFAVVAVVLALRALDGDPTTPWWTIGALAAMSARSVWIAWYEGRYGFMWIAASLANIAVSAWWAEIGQPRFGSNGEVTFLEFLWVNVLPAAAMAVVSVLVTVAPRSLSADGSRPSRLLEFHRFAAWAIAVVLLLTTAVGLFADLLALSSGFQSANMALQWAAWVAGFFAAVACWWDARSRWPVACLYTVGLAAVGIYLDGLNFAAPMIFWALAMALAAYSLLTSFLWSRRGEIANFLARLRVPIAGRAESGHYWLVTVNGLSAIVVLALVALIEIRMPEFQRRMVAAYAVGAEALALALLARGAVRSSLQYSALVFGVLFAVAFGWAWLPPDYPAPWLHRTIAAVAALALMIVVYGFGLVKLLRRENEWTRAAGQLVPLLAVVAAMLLLLVLGMEVSAYAENGEVPIAWQARLAVALALVGLAVAGIVAAIVPGRDPLGLSERGRTAYVYAAEVLAGLTFLHIRVTMPWLFSGWFLRFWPLVVMAIAFIGVGLSEFFRRRRQNVLSQPLATTGSLLPLLPALGFWMTPSEVHYSLLLLSVGVLYAAMSALRKSFLFAVLAALAANGSLWYMLYTHEGLGIAQHPQLWLIPPALCMLAAGYLNRARLSPEQSAALRYGSAIVIYVSSTADIFINGVANAPWLPAVLAGLSILGVFAGILLRVRAFLYLGTAFLIVAILSIIWYAAVEQQRTWILWVAGIVTGVLIIALFGVFEKRRDDVLRLVERMKQWEA